MTLFEEKFLDKIAFMLLNALLFTGEANYILNKLDRNEKVKLVQQLPQIKMAPAQKQLVRKEVEKSLAVPKAIPVNRSVVATDFKQKVMNHIQKSEGVRNKLYKDHYGNWTIGVGHLVSPEELSKFRGKTLTNKEIFDIFSNDVDKKISMIKQEFPKFESYPESLKIMMIDGYFRGDLSGSPLTKNLIKRGLFKQAAREYLNNAEYRRETQRRSGVAKRMFHNASILKKL